MNIYELVEETLSTLEIPFAAGRYLVASGSSLPDLYLVYKVVSNLQEQAADDQETERTFRVQVSIFSRSGLTSLPDVSGAMVSAGFSKSRNVEIPFDEDTKHFGIVKEFVVMFDEGESE